jgi:5'-nucleotidase
LLRMQNGGCHPTDCQGPHPFTGAKFHYLAASTIETATGKSVFPAYEIREFDGIPIAFIGLTLKGTAGIVAPKGIVGLEFRDEAETVNALIPELKARGVEAIVVLIHQGGVPTGDYNECPDITGPIVDIVRKFDRAVDVIISGHTHRAYVCDIDGRLVTSADKYGTLVTAIDLKLDPATRDIVSAKAQNVIVANASLAKDPEQTALIAAYDKIAAPKANLAAGSVTENLSLRPNEAGESPLGDVIADAQLAASSAEKDGGAVIALTNPGGIRTDVIRRDDGTVSFGDLFASQPFRNRLVTMTLTGAQLKDLLEQQWPNPQGPEAARPPRILQVSKGFSYAWDASRPFGQHVAAERMMLDGKTIEPAASYRVTINDYLAGGGDGFTVASQGASQLYGGYDADALFAYFKASGKVAPPPLSRIQRLN